MNKGVEILLERMKSNPDEFYDEGTGIHIGTKWGRVIAHHQEFLDPEDKEMLQNGLKKLHQQKFTEKIMEELLDPKSLEDVINQYRVKGMPSVGQTLASSMAQSKAMLTGATLNAGAGTGYTWANTGAVTGTISANSLTIGQTQLQEEQVKHMLAHLDWLKREEQLKEKEKPKTIFGKLFNYT